MCVYMGIKNSAVEKIDRNIYGIWACNKNYVFEWEKVKKEYAIRIIQLINLMLLKPNDFSD